MQQNTIKGRPEIQDSGPHIIQVRLSGFQIIEKLNKLKKKRLTLSESTLKLKIM